MCLIRDYLEQTDNNNYTISLRLQYSFRFLRIKRCFIYFYVKFRLSDIRLNVHVASIETFSQKCCSRRSYQATSEATRISRNSTMKALNLSKKKIEKLVDKYESVSTKKRYTDSRIDSRIDSCTLSTASTRKRCLNTLLKRVNKVT